MKAAMIILYGILSMIVKTAVGKSSIKLSSIVCTTQENFQSLLSDTYSKLDVASLNNLLKATDLQCSTMNELMSFTYKTAKNTRDGSMRFIPEDVIKLCPAILQQIVSGACALGEDSKKHNASSGSINKPTNTMKYGYGTLSMLVINLLPFAGLILLPRMGNVIYKFMIQFSIALGVGTITGDALLSVIPEVLQDGEVDKSQENKTYIYKMLAAIGGMYLFYLIESLLDLFNLLKRLRISRSSRNITTIEESSGVEAVLCGITPFLTLALIGNILHGFADGLFIGTAYGTGLIPGVNSSIAIFCHELPYAFSGNAIYLKNGISKKKVACINAVVACFGFIGFYIGLRIAGNPEVRGWLLAFTAGMFLYLALVDVLREMNKGQSINHPELQFLLQNIGLCLGWGIILVAAVFEDKLEAFLRG